MTTTNTAPSASEVRAWARDKGLPVGTRGRLSPELLDAFHAEQSAASTKEQPAVHAAKERTVARHVQRPASSRPPLPVGAVRAADGWTVSPRGA